MKRLSLSILFLNLTIVSCGSSSISEEVIRGCDAGASRLLEVCNANVSEDFEALSSFLSFFGETATEKEIQNLSATDVSTLCQEETEGGAPTSDEVDLFIEEINSVDDCQSVINIFTNSL